MNWLTSRHAEFALPMQFAIGAVFFFAITGALAAMRRHYDIVGVFVMAFVAGLGGGLIRDGIFIQDGPPALTRDWRYLGAVVGGCIVGWLLGKFIERFQRLIALIDAAGLATFSVVGVQMSRAAGLSVPASIFVGVINACGGGLLRDIIVRDEPLMMKPGQFYVMASLIGCGLFAYLTTSKYFDSYNSALIAIAVTF
ncbi:MAG: TRIC cation channel family protein [Nibricoccus sp.]